MTTTVFLAVLLAAALHAGWNAVVKAGEDRLVSITVVTLFSALGGLLAIPLVGVPQAQALPWLGLSVVLHTGYRIFLARAYEAGDFGQVYPLARGSAPLVVAIAGLALIGEAVRPGAFAGIIVLCGGVMVMTFRGGRLAAGLGLHASAMALVTSLFIAGYTLADGLGARANQSAHAYAAWLFFLDGIVIWIIVGWMRGRHLLRAAGRHWKAGLAAGLMSVVAYWIAIWAMTQAPVALVAALRETSVLFGSLISVLILREGLSWWRGAGALLIVAGVAAIRLA